MLPSEYFLKNRSTHNLTLQDKKEFDIYQSENNT